MNIDRCPRCGKKPSRLKIRKGDDIFKRIRCCRVSTVGSNCSWAKVIEHWNSRGRHLPQPKGDGTP